MKKILYVLFVVFLFTEYSVFAQGEGIRLRQTTKSGIYKKGQQISVKAFTGDHKGDSLNIRVLKNNLTELINKSVKIESDSMLLFEGSFTDPCTVIVMARIEKERSAIGFAVDPKKLNPGGSRPSDFDSYWNEQRKSLNALPMDIKSSGITDAVVGTGFSCENIEINCLGPKPARGYFAKPAIAAPKSLPGVILVHAAGVKGSWCRSEPGNAMKYAKMGALCFDLNAHGMLNGQPDSYYADLEVGELKNYYLQGMSSRDDFYFRGMYLRLLRAIDFLSKQPEWDGKRILVIGESQGGGQALIAAGIDKRVSAVVAIVPAMCDLLAPLADRRGGWPQPYESSDSKDVLLKTLPYFDAANMLKGSKAKICVEIGLIDVTCPAATVYAAINQSKGKKIVYAVPYRAHHQPQDYNLNEWKETVSTPRELFIKEYLK